MEEAIENIDIGGPSMLRSAAKNYKNVAAVCDPGRYETVLNELDVNSGILSDTVLLNLALDVYRLTAKYDSMIYNFLNARLKSGEFSTLPQELSLRFSKVMDLRYGENPHQMAAFYRDSDGGEGLPQLKQLHGKELSFNNILDLNAAVNLIKEFELPAAVIIKHNNPTGVAQDRLLSTAYKKAWECDKLSAFGGIIGVNRKLDAKTAELIYKSGFMECIIAPSFDKGAAKRLSQKKNLRLVELDFSEQEQDAFDFRKVRGGVLLQKSNARELSPGDWKVSTKVAPQKKDIPSMLFGWKVVKHVRSNAIVLVKGNKTVGIGCGQTSRVDSARIALSKAGKNATGSLLFSDAFLPKPDTVEIAAKAGIKMIMQTGGSIADQDVIQVANRAKIAMVMTGIRHFKH